jgi:hypothetical protein
MREPEIGTTLGKCVIDTGVIIEGSGLKSDYAVLRQGKWICGDCLLGLSDEVFGAFIEQQQNQKIESDNLLEKVKEYGWAINQETGKLEKL